MRSLLDLARPGSTESTPGDLNQLLHGFAASIAARIPQGVDVELDLAVDLPRVIFDATQLAEALDILVVNAFEAMKGAGRIVMRTRLDADAPPPGAVLISVADSGPGIEAGRFTQLFDLFYTTKPTGTGVGLAMAKRLVERQHGTIGVTSTPGRGAVFSVRLPLASGAARAVADASP